MMTVELTENVEKIIDNRMKRKEKKLKGALLFLLDNLELQSGYEPGHANHNLVVVVVVH